MKGYKIKAIKFEGIRGQIEWAVLPHGGVVDVRKETNYFCWKIFVSIGERINECILKGIAQNSEQAKEQAEKAWQLYVTEYLESQ
jgi:hypothetical protein